MFVINAFCAHAELSRMLRSEDDERHGVALDGTTARAEAAAPRAEDHSADARRRAADHVDDAAAREVDDADLRVNRFRPGVRASQKDHKFRFPRPRGR